MVMVMKNGLMELHIKVNLKNEKTGMQSQDLHTHVYIFFIKAKRKRKSFGGKSQSLRMYKG